MEINAQFDQPVAIKTETLEWKASPMAGVDRRMLDRVGDEVARATSIVRYASGSAFSEHTHSGGEEFIVLDGVFQDEHADYPAGTYVRNPVGTHHIPRSELGCTIFVKLWQFDSSDQEQLAIDLNTVELQDIGPSKRYSILAQRDYETVTLEEWSANSAIVLQDSGGLEILILDGEITFNGQTFHRQDWLRIPPNTDGEFGTGAAPARLWIKRGHLAAITVPPQN